jgi:hypothetical protein
MSKKSEKCKKEAWMTWAFNNGSVSVEGSTELLIALREWAENVGFPSRVSGDYLYFSNINKEKHEVLRWKFEQLKEKMKS